MNKTVRCAVYTRKSTDEGLDQAFNSLHAQREACEAFITSQRHEGWKLVPKAFDDGGYSGGSMERPALSRLMDDVRRGSVEVIVVYKIDRLTRSLADFARIVEVLDAQGASFVSVTQQFNTTTSMGRLTLNVLLSFAQFEREVTGERIRDKIAASKSKGMWMGGPPPIGYDIRNRKLVVNEDEAACVRGIYERYLQLGSVTELAVDLRDRGIRSKCWVSTKGIAHGGGVFARGALYKVLRNRLYIGEVPHKGRAYPGDHDGIVPKELWEKVNQHLTNNRHTRSEATTTANTFLLQKLLHDDNGNLMSPHYTRKCATRAYRYYVSQGHIRKEKSTVGSVGRVPAQAIEDLVQKQLELWMPKDEYTEWTKAGMTEKRRQLCRWVERIEICKNALIMLVHTTKFSSTEEARRRLRAGSNDVKSHGDLLEVRLPLTLQMRGGKKELVLPEDAAPQNTRTPDPKLVKAMVQAYRWRRWVEAAEVKTMADIAQRAGCAERHVRRLMPLAFLAPDIMKAILDGRTPAVLTLSRLTAVTLPLSWPEQRRRLGFT